MKKINFSDSFILLIAFLGPFSITFLDVYNLILISILVLMSLIIQLKKTNSNLLISRESKIFIVCYIISVVFSCIGMLSNLGSFSHVNVFISFISRLITISIGLLTLMLISSWAVSVETYKLKYFINVSFFVTFVFLFFGVYQIISVKYNLPFIETRSNVYGADYTTQQNLGFRLTSLAREPNFYSPLIFESLIISYLVLKKKYYAIFTIITLYIMLKTYSTGVYIHFTFLLFFVFFISKVKPLYKLSLVFILAIFFYDTILNVNFDIYNYVINKFSNEASGDSFRSYVYITIIKEFMNSDLINLFFGNGINTLTNFGDITGNYNLVNVSVSNNLFIDFLWDSGLLGLFSIIFPIVYLFFSNYKYKNNNKYYFCAICLLFSLFVSSLYRSEYTTSHFFWVIGNILVLLNISKREL